LAFSLDSQRSVNLQDSQIGDIPAKTENATTFIYGLTDPDSGKIRYVGKSNNPQRRRKAHMDRSGTSGWHSAAWLNSLKAAGKRPGLVVLEEVSQDCWSEAERRWIKQLREQGADLTNTTEGGDAPAITTESRKKMSIAKKGIPRGKMSAETIAKISATKRGKKRKPHTAEARRKIGLAQKGRQFTPEHRAKISAAKMGHSVPEKTRLAVAASNRARARRKHSDDPVDLSK
jgi:hypothetical protein